MSHKKNININDRTFIVALGGSDTESGQTFETANATIAQSIANVNAQDVPPDAQNPSAILINGGGTFSEPGLTIPEGCQFDGSNAFSLLLTGNGFTPGNSTTFRLAVAGTFGDSTVVYDLLDRNESTVITGALGVFGENGAGIHVRGTANLVKTLGDQIRVAGVNSFGILDEKTNDSGTPEVYSHDQITLEADGACGFRYNPSLSTSRATIVSSLIGITNSPTGTIGIEVLNGCVDAVVNRIDAADGFIVDNGGILNANVVSLNGDITVNAGGVLNCEIIDFTGTITNNGTINGTITSNGETTHFGDVTILDNLLVEGTTTFLNVENLSVADRYIGLNQGYEAEVAVTDGIVAHYFPLSTNDTVTAGAFTAGVASTSNPTIITDGSATFSPTQFVQVSGTNTGENDGIFEVSTHVGTLLTFKGVGTVATVDDSSRTQLVTNASDSATIRHMTITVIRNDTAGIWEQGEGSSTPITYTPIQATPGTPVDSVQFNNPLGTFAGSPNFIFDGDKVSIGGVPIPRNVLHVQTFTAGVTGVTEADTGILIGDEVAPRIIFEDTGGDATEKVMGVEYGNSILKALSFNDAGTSIDVDDILIINRAGDVTVGAGDFSSTQGRKVSMRQFNANTSTDSDTLDEIYNLVDIFGDTTLTISTSDIAKGSTTNPLVLTVKDTSGDIVSSGFTFTIATEGAETIDGAASIQITVDYGVARLFSDGSNLFSI